MEKPKSLINAKVPISETGMVTAGMMVARQSSRNSEDDQDHDDDGFSQRDHHFANRVADNGGRVEGDSVFKTGRKALGKLLQCSLRLGIDVEGIGGGKLLHADALGDVAAVFQVRTVVFRADDGVSDILQFDQAVGTVLDDDVVELRGIAQPADDAYWNLEGLRRVGRRLAELAGGNFDVLLQQRIDHVVGGKTARRQTHRVEPDAHGVFAFAEDHNVADAGDALEGVLHVDVEVVGDEFVGVAAIAGEEAGAEDEVFADLDES